MQVVHVERQLETDRRDAFRWFTEPDRLTSWWPSDADVDLTVGGAYRMHWAGPGVTLRGEYSTIDVGRRLEFTWSWDHEMLPPRSVDIRFVDGDEPGWTRVSIGHEASSDEEASGYRDGWEHFLDRLEAVVGER